MSAIEDVVFEEPSGLTVPLKKTSAMDFIVFADSHISRRIWQSCPAEHDAAFAMAQIAHYALDERTLSVVGCGDILDVSMNNSYVVDVLRRFCGDLEQDEIVPYFLHGQHDASCPPWSSSVGARYVGDTTPFNLGYLTARGQDFLNTDRCKERFGDIPCDIVFAHQRWGELVPHQESAQLRLSDVSGTRVVFSGDTHELRCVKGKNKDGEDAWLISPGATHIRAAGEPHFHHFLHCQYDKSAKRLRVHPRQLLSRSIEIRELHEADDEKKLIAELKEIGRSGREDHWPTELPRNFPEIPDDLRKPVVIVYPTTHGCDKRAIHEAADLAGVYVRFVAPTRLRETSAEVVSTESDSETSASPVDVAREILAEQLASSPIALKLCQRLLELPTDASQDAISAAINAWASSVLSGPK